MAHRCSASPLGVHGMTSDSSDKIYRVEILQKGAALVGVCECVAYAIQRNRNGGKLAGNFGDCKHIRRRIAEGGCGWNDAADGMEPQKYPTICPRCDSGVVEFDATPAEEVDVNDIIAKLKAMRAKAAT